MIKRPEILCNIAATPLFLRDNAHFGLIEKSHHTFTYIRNLCAHHSRLWNRRLSIELRIPYQEEWKNVDSKKMIGVIQAIAYMLRFSEYRLEAIDSWVKDMLILIEQALPDATLAKEMGFVVGWKDLAIWEVVK